MPIGHRPNQIYTSDEYEPLKLHTHLSPARREVEAFIQTQFQRMHQAQVRDFLPILISSLGADRRIRGAAGFQLATENRLFLEAYLDSPIEQTIARLTGHAIPRDQVVEVGNLAATTSGYTRHLIAMLADHFSQMQLGWAVMTLTPTLINSFQRLQITLLPLVEARQERLSGSTSDWGHYYSHRPWVVAIHIPSAIASLQRLNRVETASRLPHTHALTHRFTGTESAHDHLAIR